MNPLIMKTPEYTSRPQCMIRASIMRVSTVTQQTQNASHIVSILVSILAQLTHLEHRAQVCAAMPSLQELWETAEAVDDYGSPTLVYPRSGDGFPTLISAITLTLPNESCAGPAAPAVQQGHRRRPEVQLRETSRSPAGPAALWACTEEPRGKKRKSQQISATPSYLLEASIT
jgi:hypothetical protein